MPKRKALADPLPTAAKRPNLAGANPLLSKSQKTRRRRRRATSRRRSHAAATRPVLDLARPASAKHVFVFGANSGAELGLGDTASSASVRRPRLNPCLQQHVVVQVAVGGMHCLALTASPTQILSWGVNDLGALGRDTAWDGGMRNVEDDDGASSDSDDDDGGKLNPKEATPTAVDVTSLPPKDRSFAWLAASDNASFAVTADGQVYGWGTFRNNDGVLGFSRTVDVQKTPVLIPGLRSIKMLAAGEDHVLALDASGSVFVWGSNDGSQLGREVQGNRREKVLKPWRLALLPPCTYVAAGSKHSFALDMNGHVWSWGQNNFGQTGHLDELGEYGASVSHPRRVAALDRYAPIARVVGGNSHSMALTRDGQCITWGRLDGFATGHAVDTLPDDAVVRDERGKPRILKVPTALPGLSPVACIAAGPEHSLACTADGKCFSWGFGTDCRTGLGHDDDVMTPHHIANSAVRDRTVVDAAGGGQFSVICALPLPSSPGSS